MILREQIEFIHSHLCRVNQLNKEIPLELCNIIFKYQRFFLELDIYDETRLEITKNDKENKIMVTKCKKGNPNGYGIIMSSKPIESSLCVKVLLRPSILTIGYTNNTGNPKTVCLMPNCILCFFFKLDENACLCFLKFLHQSKPPRKFCFAYIASNIRYITYI